MILERIITYSFYLLLLLTPLFWTSLNYELFEYNKMILTYGITIIIMGAWVYKMIGQKTLILKRTPLDIPLLLFLGANILSTIFSIDIHTSIWGYYSRSNGGLLSIISYLLLYWAFVSNMKKEQVLTTLKFGLASAFLISLWGIFEHFGVSLSCVLLRNEFNASCWVQDVQARVFATLGQPNWMASYLAMLIFPALYFYLGKESLGSFSKDFSTLLKTVPPPQVGLGYKSPGTAFIFYFLVFKHISWIIYLVAFYLAFTFTYSRGPTLGLIAGLLVFITLYFLRLYSKANSIRPILIILGIFLVINLLFGSALTNFRLVSKFASPARPAIALPPSSVTQLENGGTESGQIRFIVWRGALDIWKANPFLGTGLETFAYSYYQYRPVEHNKTSEWDFLYNKAHNEYLNYLATTGIVGFGTYILVIGTFLFWNIKRIVNHELRIKHNSEFLIIIAILSSYVSYLIYNFFLFSVVIIAIFFYLFPALIFVFTDSLSSYKLSVTSFNWLYRRPIYTKAAKVLVVVLTLYLLYSVVKIWTADTLFNQGQKASDLGNPGKAYNLISQAMELNTSEPFYRSELAFSAAQASAALEQTDATLSGALKDEAVAQMSQVLKGSPKNVSFWRTAIRTYFELSVLDNRYLDKTLNAVDQAISLAPTDPKLYYNKALILDTLGKKTEEIKVLQQALQLKPDYLEAKEQLKGATASAKSDEVTK